MGTLGSNLQGLVAFVSSLLGDVLFGLRALLEEIFFFFNKLSFEDITAVGSGLSDIRNSCTC